MAVQKSKKTDKFQQSFEALHPTSRVIFELCCLAYEPLSNTKLIAMLKKLGIKTKTGKGFNAGALAPHFKELTGHHLAYVDGGISCSKACLELGTRAALQDRNSSKLIAVIRAELPAKSNYYYSNAATIWRIKREIRLGIYLHDLKCFNEFSELGYRLFEAEFTKYDPFDEILNRPFEPEYFKTFPLELQLFALQEFIPKAVAQLRPLDAYLEMLRHYRSHPPQGLSHEFQYLLTLIAIVRGDLQEAAAAIPESPRLVDAAAQRAVVAFLRGDNEVAITCFEEALKSLRRSVGKRTVYFKHFESIFYPFAIIKSRRQNYLNDLQKIVDGMQKTASNYQNCFHACKTVLALQMNQIDAVRLYIKQAGDFKDESAALLCNALAAFWFDPKLAQRYAGALKKYYQLAETNGYNWFALEYAALLAALYPKESAYAEARDRLQQETGIAPLLPLIAPEADWQRALKALASLRLTNGRQSAATAETRLTWFVDFKHNYCQPKEQKLTKNGFWTKGRNVALKRIKTGDLPCMTQQDREIARAVRLTVHYYGNEQYYFDHQKAFTAMVGHPLLFGHNPPHHAIELVKGEPQLLVEQHGSQYEMKFSEEASAPGIRIIEETPARFRLIEVTDAHSSIAAILGKQKIVVPAEGKQQLVEAIANLSSGLVVHSEIDGLGEALETVSANDRIHCHVTPVGDGFSIGLYVRPFGESGPYFKPGKGGSSVIAEIDGKRLRARRELKLEQQHALEVVTACSWLGGDDVTETWILDEPEDCLEALLDLQTLGDQVMVEWPEGEKFRISHQASFEQLSVRINKERDWFALSGELQLDDSLVLEMHQLLKMLEATPGRFIPLDGNRFLALTEEFRRRLEEVRAFSARSKQGILFHQSASLAMQGFIDNVAELQADEHWQEQKRRIGQALTHKARVPRTLQAALRDYQVEGFQWLSQLANWGVGACLADDMGLGKTIQALAVILTRARNGPTLVVAPASVQMNWQIEASRFAPTLNVAMFGQKDREETIRNLGVFDLLITSYGLLHQEQELLQSVAWETIVLDEAQAIKNTMTKRSQAAMRLEGKFRLITTGTPIENHLGELWNLFNFINPGLLGSLQNFNEKFAAPIEKYRHKESKRQLKKLIQPFMLRRLKSEVLEELPPKTEITLLVDMSEAEQALYEALRQKTVSDLNEMTGEPGEKYLKILAAIMKLRRACCHPKLAVPNVDLPGSKLQLFKEVVSELRENNHKALVFSQFVDHLTILRAAVEELGLSYQYLDGSTPVKQRQQRVEAFQAGEGELFLISLRAGGFGLNLTAADYVIHTDPWWNPAVEDQASDRAHRIGQQRPVTIYRLVTKDTIEEKIVALHKEKRDLADSLLAEGAASAKLSSEQLMKLILQS